MSTKKDFFSSGLVSIYTPFFHAAEIIAGNGHGAGIPNGWSDRSYLNTVLFDQSKGAATLQNGNVVLQPGLYSVMAAHSMFIASGVNFRGQVAIRDMADNVLGLSTLASNSDGPGKGCSMIPAAVTSLNLAAETEIKISISASGAGTAYGNHSSSGKDSLIQMILINCISQGTGNRSRRAGQYVMPSTETMNIANNSFWIDSLDSNKLKWRDNSGVDHEVL